MEFEKKLDAELIEKIKQFLIEGDKVQAIKIVQDKFKLGLRYSKEIVDHVQKTQNLNL